MLAQLMACGLLASEDRIARPTTCRSTPAQIMGGLYERRHHRPRGRLRPRLGRAAARGYRVLFDEARSVPRRSATPRARALLCRGAPRAGRAASSTSSPIRGSSRCARRCSGPDYRIVEVGFDIPLPGAADQPWHRDFPSPPATLEWPPPELARLQPHRDRHACRSMGPFEIALGTQWDDLRRLPRSGCSRRREL